MPVMRVKMTSEANLREGKENFDQEEGEMGIDKTNIMIEKRGVSGGGRSLEKHDRREGKLCRGRRN